MKKVFLTLAMLLFAFTGVMRADEVTIGDLEGAANNSYLPMNSLYEYSFSEQIYTAEEIGAACTINSITMWLYGNEQLYTMPFDIYMAEVDKDSFESTSDWITVTASDLVYSGEITVHNTEGQAYTFTLSNPFSYSGTGNLVIAFNNNTGQWKSGLNGKVFGESGDPVRSIYARRDGTAYDIANLPAATSTTYQRNVVTLDVSAGGGAPVTVVIGDLEGAANNSYLPMNSLYEYSFSEQIYTAEEMTTGGTINAITMWLYGNEQLYTMPFDIYMVEVSKDVFESTSDWVSVTESNLVYSGAITVHNAEAEPYTFTLTTPFSYSGTGNLVIAFNNNTGQWKSGLNGKVFGESGGPVRAIYARRDSTPYDITNLPAATATTYQRNVISIDMTSGGGAPTPPPAPVNADLIVEPEELNLGHRPIGAWMEPYTFKFKSVDANVNINQVINGSNSFMTVNLQTPVLVELDGEGVEATITTNNYAPGEYTEQFAVDFNGTRVLKTFSMSAVAYEPVEGDVVEMAKEVTIPYSGTAPAGIYRNYNIDENEAENAIDAVYEVTLENAAMLSVTTTGANGIAKLYAEDFNGEPGPMVDNNYEYSTGGGLAPADIWFTYPYTGSNTFFGTSAGGGMLFGYKVPTSYLAGIGHCFLTAVDAAARESYPYNLYVLRGGETPGDATLVCYQEMAENPEAMNFFDIPIAEPFAIGETEDLWVMFYSASPYAAYCGKQAEDVANAKIWYSLDGSNWSSNETYTPVIYLHLQYPNPEDRGEVVLNLADMSIQHINGNGTLGEAKGEVTLPVHQNISKRGNMINDMFVPAGTYYVVVASTDENFDVNITTTEVPAPEQAVIITPEDGQLGVANGDLFQWELGSYTDEFQVLLGTQFPPTDVLVDWTNNLFESITFANLQHNKTYFAQVNARNGAGTTYGQLIGFTTEIDGTSNFAVENANLYPGDAAVFTWDAVGRSLQGYNLYKDGELVNETPINETTYAVEGLEYNMEGYAFQLSVVFDEGESALSEPITVKMTGFGTVSGMVYEQDGETIIAGASVEVRGVDQYGQPQSFATVTNDEGAYTVDAFAGTGYRAYAYKDGYQETPSADVFAIAYEGVVENINVFMYEAYNALGQVSATYVEDDNNVLVEWDWAPAEMVVDFETGDFSQAEFTLPATYPWTVTTTNPYEGTYCMKSTCEGVASASSTIEATVNVPFEAGKMGFWVRTSSESNYDKFHFYIDGVEQGQALSGNNPYAYKEYAVTQGTHTYKWEYTKDSSVNSNDDCIYVDNITMFRQDVPLPPVQGATTYDFEDETMMGWTSIDADNDGYGWVSSGNPGQYHNAGVSLAGTGHNASQGYVISGSYSNSAGVALNPDNYLVTPTQISAENGAQIQFYACAQDASYAAEHFGVAVSTTTATAAAFTTIQEWTMTAKGPQGRTAESEFDIRGTRAQGNWYLYTVDLSSYAGQDIWVAIRHFNCYDMFILNVDDIVVADGSAKGAVVDNNRSLQSFKLYRRNVHTDSVAVEIAPQIASDVFSYTDESYANLPFGMYQWGVRAYYEGNAATREEVVIGEGATTNAYLPTYTYYNYSLTEQIYTADEVGGAGTISSVSFFNQGAERERNIAVYMANTSKSEFADGYDWVNLTDADKVFEGTVTFATNEWLTINFSTPFAYTGGNLILGVDDNTGSYQSAASFSADNTTAPMALRIYNDNVNFDPANATNYSGTALSVRNQIKLQTTGGGGPVPGTGLSEITWSNVIEKDMYSNVTVHVSLNNGQTPVGVNVALGNSTATTDESGTAVFSHMEKGEYVLTVSMPDFDSYTENVVLDDAEEVFNVVLNENVGPIEDMYVSPTGWAMWAGTVPGGSTPTPPGPTQGQWYYYDSGENQDAIGLTSGGSFYWGILFPAGSYQGNSLTKVAYYDYSAHTGTVSIYQGGTDAPATLLHSQDYSVNGTEAYIEIEMTEAVTVDNSQSLWVVMHNNNGQYVAAIDAGPGVANASCISMDGSTWYNTVSAASGGSLDGNWNLRAYIEGSAKGVDRGALSYKVNIDGTYEGETIYPYFQHNVEGFEAGSEHTTSVAAIYATGMGDWVDYTWIYTPCDEFSGATDVEGSQNGNAINLTWTIPGGSTPPTPPTPPTPGNTFDFDDSTMQGWTSIDADGDSYGWGVGSASFSSTGLGHNASTDMVVSASYINNVGALNPDNYLVSPAKGVYPSISFWACGQDASYVAEHFGVAVSTTTATSSAFTMVQEWTMTAKGNGQPTNATRSGSRAQGSWHEYTVDLSAYAGQEIWVAIRHFNVTDMFFLDVDDITLGGSSKSRDMWDYVYSFSGTSAGQQAIATDGQYIYTASWQATPTGGHTFYKYDLQGTFIEGFDIAGATGIRDLTTDGTYFYGTSGGAQIFVLDFTNHTLVSTINCSGLTSRHISYDPVRDGFWSGNWSTLALYSRTGSVIQQGAAPSSAYGSAYYKDADNVEHLYLFCQPNSDAKVYDYNITTNTISSSPLLDFASTPGYTTGIAGGCFVGEYNGSTCWFGNAQQDPNLIGIYELAAGSGPTPPPTPGTGAVLGAYVFRDGELISGVTPITTGAFSDQAPSTGANEYCVRVVYDDYSMSCPVCVTVDYECIPVNNLQAVYTYHNTNEYGVTLSWNCAQAQYVQSYDIYFTDILVASVTDMSYFVDMTHNPGVYTFGVVANYGYCESEMVTANVTVTDVDEYDSNVTIYPNPTNSNVTIKAADMNHITVVNALGQVVYDADIDADMFQMDLGQYNTGIYVIRVNTANGVSVNRVTVVK